MSELLRVASLRGTLVWLLALCLVPGCILIRTTEHRIKVNEDGTGEAVLRLTDLRSDASQDSLVARDFEILIASFQKEGIADFEKMGRKVTDKKLFLQGDTLVAEITYTFPSLDAVEGLRVTPDEIYVVVNQQRDIVRTNGTPQTWQEHQKRIRWDRNARRIYFRIRENSLPPSVSLAGLYRKWSR